MWVPNPPLNYTDSVSIILVLIPFSRSLQVPGDDVLWSPESGPTECEIRLGHLTPTMP